MKMRLLRTFWSDRRGAFAPLAALVLTVILGFGALAIDMGYAYYMRNKLQVAADASALAGASQLEFLPDQSTIVPEALQYADNNMPSATYDDVLVPADVVVGNWNPDTRTFTAGLNPLDAVMTTTRQQESAGNAVPAFLGGIVGFSSYDANASAIATYGVGDPLFPSGCIMTLSEHEEKAFYISGTADISLTKCSIEVASDAACAMEAKGTPTITRLEGDDSSAINVAGTYCEKGAVNVDPPPTQNYTGDISNPYRNTDPCEQGLNCNAPCDHTNFSESSSVTLEPGVYCGGITLNGNGTAIFEAGDYIIRDGGFNVDGGIALDGGDGVGFYLQGSGSVVDFGGNSAMNLVAQNSGSALDGFIFFEEEKNPQESRPHRLRGTNGGGYEGVLYFSGNVDITGTADAGLGGSDSDCTVLIASKVEFSGTSGFEADATCAGFDGPPAGVGDMMVRLVN
jgi:Flp pilus assembly protein TadG